MNLPFLLAGGVIAYLVINKQKATSSKSSLISKPGYQIKNCNSFVIKNKNEATWYAFKEGMKYNSDLEVFTVLFGGLDCFLKMKDKSEEACDFVYMMILYYFAGAFKESKITLDKVASMLKELRYDISLEGIDTSEWYTEENIKPIIAAYNNGQSENI